MRLSSALQQDKRAILSRPLNRTLVNQTGLARVKAEVAVQSVFDSLKGTLARGDRIELRGFGIFTVQPRKTGVGRNPRTREEAAIAPGYQRPARPRGSRSQSPFCGFYLPSWAFVVGDNTVESGAVHQLTSNNHRRDPRCVSDVACRIGV